MGRKGQVPWNKDRTGVYSEETRNNLGMYWRNLIGSIVVSHREPDYYKNTIKQIYKYIIPVKTEIDTFASKTEELASEYRNEK